MPFSQRVDDLYHEGTRRELGYGYVTVPRRKGAQVRGDLTPPVPEHVNAGDFPRFAS